MTVATLYNSSNLLGESPFWHAERRSLFWVDIEQGLVQELDWATRQVQSWDIKRRVSAILKEKNDSLVLAVQGGLVSFDLNNGSYTWLAEIEMDIPDRRCNDGAVDSHGRIWVGVMDVHCKPEKASLYRLNDFAKPPVKMIEGLTIPNGLVWSLDNKHMYFIDTISRAVKSYSFNLFSGEIHYEREAVTVPEEMGMPDGMTIDQEGMLWVALYGGYAISRWNPANGELLQLIKIPAPNVTNCCFAGDDLDVLVVTTARENLTEQQLTLFPDSGNLFIITSPDVKGTLPPAYSAKAT